MFFMMFRNTRCAPPDFKSLQCSTNNILFILIGGYDSADFSRWPATRMKALRIVFRRIRRSVGSRVSTCLPGFRAPGIIGFMPAVVSLSA
jgi:hypothetical protein